MRIVVVSDSHGNKSLLYKAVASQPEARIVMHLGDGIDDCEELREKFPHIQFIFVQGNNDGIRNNHYAERKLEIIMKKRFFLAHGHRYSVKFGFGKIICAAHELEADVLLFGHTHQAFVTYEDGLYIVNPGSLGYNSGTYATVDILGNSSARGTGIVTNIIKVKI